MRRRWLAWGAWIGLSLLIVGVATALVIGKRPVPSPRYNASAWDGEPRAYTGVLTSRDDGATVCWYLKAGAPGDPAAPIGVVLPDTYRTFRPSLSERGADNSSPTISGSSLWAGQVVAADDSDVTATGELGGEADWVKAARAQWHAYCPDVDRILVVQPDGLERSH